MRRFWYGYILKKIEAMAIIFQIIINGLLLSAVYALLGAGVSFLYSTSRIFHLAHGVVAVGASFTFWWVWEASGLNPAVAVLAAVFVAAAAGFLMNEYVYEVLRRRGARGLGYLIATLALLMLGTGILLAIFGAAPRTFKFESAILDFGGIHISVLEVWLLLITVLLLLFFYWLSHYTKFGKAMRATADNEEVAEVLGIDTKNIRRLAFVLASVLAAVAGIIHGLEFSLDVNKGALLAVFGFAAAVVGGVGSLGGAILGSLIMGLSEQAVLWFLGGGARNAVAFVLLFVFLLFKPSGILGKKREL